ncbi:MAG: hypothetical protein ACTSYI_07075 [Promethearchaeota archaeon]
MISNFIILRNGLPITNISVDGTKKFQLTKDANTFTLVSGFFQAINSFADSVEDLGQIDEVQMTDLLFTFQRKSIAEKNKELLFILTTEGKTNKTLRKIIIEEASSTFLYMFGKNLKKEWNGDIKPYRKFEKVFKEILENILENHPQEEETEANHITEDDLPALVYKMPEITTSIPLNSYGIQNTQPRDYTEPKFNPSSNISKRFQDYQTLQQSQRRFSANPSMNTSGFLRGRNLNNSMEANRSQMQRFGGKSQIPIPIPIPIRSENQNYDASPYHQSGSPYPSNPFQSNGYNTNSNPNLSPYQNFQSRSAPSFNYPPMEESYSNRKYYRPPVHELIPVKSRLTAGIFRNQIENSWIKVLMVAIDGRKSLNNLADLLQMPLSDVIQACEYLERQHYISFKQ